MVHKIPKNLEKLLINDTENTLLIIKKIINDLPNIKVEERFLYNSLLNTYKKEYNRETHPTTLYHHLSEETQETLDRLTKEIYNILCKI